jgi:tRNA(fMet)-specific endonuclease VapC
VDDDHVADYLKGQRRAVEFLDELLPEGLAISIITYAEVYEGIYYGQERTRHETGFREFLDGVTVLGITRSVARQFAILRGDLRAKVQLIGQTDLLIAATAIQHNLTLVTRNIKDYQRIPNLKMYQ